MDQASLGEFGLGAFKDPPKRAAPERISEPYLLSVTYDGDQRRAVLKFYDPETGGLRLWQDDTGHKPYLLTNLSPTQLANIPAVASHPGLDHFETVEKWSPLQDQPVQVTRVVAQDPLAIGGRPFGSLRDIIPQAVGEENRVKVWEADIKYYENYIYDLDLQIGMPYRLDKGRPQPLGWKPPREVLEEVEREFKGESPESLDYIKRWIELLECPVPQIGYSAVDIEVGSPTDDKVPDPHQAAHPVICASMVTSEGGRRVLLLRRGRGEAHLPEGVEVEYFDREADLLERFLGMLTEYPVVFTFNGDDFDFRYLSHRAEALGVPREKIPIQLGREAALLTSGVHIDLYKFFFNRSIQIYAFDQKYRETGLHDVAMALLNTGKIQLTKKFSDLTPTELAAYCLQDSEITFKLAAREDNLVLKLIIALARVARMPLEDVARQGVSNWIRSMIYGEHRRRGFLIPTSEELLKVKGATSTTAIIKGKKYRGGVVIEPKPGVQFNVAVLDFSSLYPSIIKRWNLSYETVLCPHPECRSHTIPETSHWVCTKRQGLTSLLIGSLRDLRVRWYKAKAKSKALPEELRSWYSVVQRTLKVVLNAAYGVFGAEHFSLYCPPVAEATASVGRYAIMSTIQKAQGLGIEVIYGDTDSIFLQSPSEPQIRELVEWSRGELGMDLDVDKVYRYSVFSTRKKNYVGVYPDGSVDIKGMTGKKRNTPEFLKDAFDEMVAILSQVKSPKDFASAKERIKEIARNCYLKVKNRGYSLKDLAFTVVLGKGLEEYDKTTPQHVKALLHLPESERVSIGAGSVVKYVKIRRDPGVKLLSRANLEEVDSEKYIEHIQTTFDQVLDALDIDFSGIIGVSKLESFFKG